ncbi:interleukin-12 subunit beta [Amphiprion ocellaris]|uniref:Interleukin-12 subunit beta n=1 Tax=Amphiprion ocellaris TaxID=80972 RepID=A0AAQ6ACR4_AMPOC|nr:interleukin-12 subunit beta [Amphiprion ocellaris]
MHAFFLLVLCAVVCGVSSNSQQVVIETLMDNVVVLRVPHGPRPVVNVPLSCGEAYQNQPVFWKKNGVEMNPSLVGNHVTVSVEEMKGGNFTCHFSPDGDALNHTIILIQLQPDKSVILEKKSPAEGYIHCSAPNYKGSFHCTWTRTEFRTNAAVLLVKAQRYMENIPCELNADGSGVHCQDANCPYNEERHRISLAVYIYSSSLLEAYTKSFYLREIVRPAKLPNLQLSDGRVFSWDYPDSWEKPCTFFGLQFEVKAVHSGHSCHSDSLIMSNTTDQTRYEVNIKTRRYVFCVRAQDKHTSGPWSHWSQCTVNKNNVSC